MLREILHKRFWTLVLFLVALGGVATALFELDEIRRAESESWDWVSEHEVWHLFPSARAESGVRVRVEVPEATFADELIPAQTIPCTVTDIAGRTQTYPGRSAICAFDAASRAAGFTYDIVLYGYQGLITELAQNGVEAKTLIWFLINNEFPESGDCHPMYGVSITTCPVDDGDELLMFSDDDGAYPPLALTIRDSDVLINERVHVNVTDARTGEAVSGASVRFGVLVIQTDTSGDAVFSSTVGETLKVYAEKDQYIRSRHLPLGIQDVAAVSVTVEERTDIEKNRSEGVTTTMLDELFLDHATVLGAILQYCEEESYLCRANDTGELLEFRGMSDLVVTKNDRESTNLLESVNSGDHVRVALPNEEDESEPESDAPPSPPVTPPANPPSNDSPPPSSPPDLPAPTPTNDSPNQDDSLSRLDPTPVITPIIPTDPEPPSHEDEPARDDENAPNGEEEKGKERLDDEAQDVQAENLTRESVSDGMQTTVAAIMRREQKVPETQEGSWPQEETDAQTDTRVAFESLSQDDQAEQTAVQTPTVRGVSASETDALWLIVLFVVSSGAACITGIRLLRYVASSGRSA